MHHFRSVVGKESHTMFKLALVSAFFVAVYGLPYDEVRTGAGAARILAQDQAVNPDGSYQWRYETENGIQAQENGILKTLPEGQGSAAKGSYRYTAPRGEPIEVTYIADENGFHAEGNAIPQPPATPPLILKALEWIAAHPEPEVRQVVQPVNKYYQ